MCYLPILSHILSIVCIVESISSAIERLEEARFSLNSQTNEIERVQARSND